MLFDQHFDKPHLSGRWIVLVKELTNKDVNKYVFEIWEK